MSGAAPGRSAPTPAAAPGPRWPWNPSPAGPSERGAAPRCGPRGEEGVRVDEGSRGADVDAVERGEGTGGPVAQIEHGQRVHVHAEIGWGVRGFGTVGADPVA